MDRELNGSNPVGVKCFSTRLSFESNSSDISRFILATASLLMTSILTSFDSNIFLFLIVDFFFRTMDFKTVAYFLILYNKRVSSKIGKNLCMFKGPLEAHV